jgi:hypothetical protein
MLLQSYRLVNQKILLAKAKADSGVCWNAWVELVDVKLKIKLRLLELLSSSFSSILAVGRAICILALTCFSIYSISRNNSAM